MAYNRIAGAGSFRADWVRPVATRNISFKKKCSIRPDLVARNWANLIKMSVSACVRRPLLGFVELRGLQTTTCASQATRQGRLRATSCQDTWRLWRDCWFSTTWPSTSSDAAFESRHSIGSEPGLCVPQKLVHSPNLVSSHVDQRWAGSSCLSIWVTSLFLLFYETYSRWYRLDDSWRPPQTSLWVKEASFRGWRPQVKTTGTFSRELPTKRGERGEKVVVPGRRRASTCRSTRNVTALKSATVGFQFFFSANVGVWADIRRHASHLICLLRHWFSLKSIWPVSCPDFRLISVDSLTWAVRRGAKSASPTKTTLNSTAQDKRPSHRQISSGLKTFTKR